MSKFKNFQYIYFSIKNYKSLKSGEGGELEDPVVVGGQDALVDAVLPHFPATHGFPNHLPAPQILEEK